MKIIDIAEQIEKIVPLGLAQDWDNVGLLIGEQQKNVKNILLTIDVTGGVVAEAVKLKTDLIVSYHPVIWDGLKKINSEGPNGTVYELIRRGIAVFSIHTALDSAIGGVNDGLAEIVGIKEPKPIGDYVDNPARDNYKLIVFVPLESAAGVSVPHSTDGCSGVKGLITTASILILLIRFLPVLWFKKTIYIILSELIISFGT